MMRYQNSIGLTTVHPAHLLPLKPSLPASLLPRPRPCLFPLPKYRLMQQAVEHFQQELAGVRTGRAHPGLLENLLVDASGDHIPIKACGTVTVRNPQLLAVVLFDASVSDLRVSLSVSLSRCLARGGQQLGG